MTLNEAIQIMTDEIVSVLIDNPPSIYLFGSASLDDFRFGWSDIDIFVLTEHEIAEQQAKTLVGLRQELLERYPCNTFFRLFEGGMISADAFLNGKNERAVYWGSSGQRLASGYKLDSFGMTELLDSGKLLYGYDVRDKMTYPSYSQMRDDIAKHVQSAREHGVVASWLLDIARGIYTLRTGKIIGKTAAGEWALKNRLCPDTEILKKAVEIRKSPVDYSNDEKNINNAVIQRFADIIEAEFSATVRLFAESELRCMKIKYNKLSLIREKDGVSVWRVSTDDDSVVMKCFDKPEYRREINNYKLLNTLDVPTLNLIAYTGHSLVIEDIERSIYRLATMEDINDPNIAAKIALWYKTLHQNGREYANTHDFIDQSDALTLENMKLVQEKTNTGNMKVWRFIEEHFEEIRSAVMKLPCTLVYTDFHYSNLAVARDGSSALVFDYNFFFKSYVYSDIRNVCGNFYNADAKAAFLSAYGVFDEHEVVVDDVASVLSALIIACSRKVFPDWAKGLLERVKDGRLYAATAILLENMV